MDYRIELTHFLNKTDNWDDLSEILSADSSRGGVKWYKPSADKVQLNEWERTNVEMFKQAVLA